VTPLDPVVRCSPQVAGPEDDVENAPNGLGWRVITRNQKLGVYPTSLQDRILYVSQMILHSFSEKARYGEFSFQFGFSPAKA
jgi:hypothetical protein